MSAPLSPTRKSAAAPPRQDIVAPAPGDGRSVGARHQGVGAVAADDLGHMHRAGLGERLGAAGQVLEVAKGTVVDDVAPEPRALVRRRAGTLPIGELQPKAARSIVVDDD